MKIFNGHLEEVILMTLFKNGPVLTTDIVKASGATKQGVYRVLRKLKSEEKITVFKSVVSLNELWIFKLSSLLSTQTQGSSLVGDLSRLKEKEKMSLKIKTLTHLDQVWTNVFLSIEQKIDFSMPLYLYNPHNWFYLLREKTDRVHMERLSKKNRMTFLTVSSSSNSDQEIRRLMRTEKFRYAINTKINLNKYLAALGDYVIEVILSENSNAKINDAFKKLNDLEEVKSELYEIDKSAVGRIVVEKNATKASSLIKRLSRNFI